MRIFFTALFIGVSSVAQLSFAQNFSPNQIAKLQGKKDVSYEDLAHENEGCPENSICSKSAGLVMKRWDLFLKSLKSSARPAPKIEAYRKKRGLPVTFLTKKDASIGIDPIFFNSRCPHHNPKDDPSARALKGIQFFKNDPQSSSILLSPARLFTESGALDFSLPYEEAPIMIENGRLIVPRDHENIYYHLSIGPKGDWKVVSPSSSGLKKALQESQETACPKSDGPLPQEGLYLKNYCRKIWNADKKKAQTIKLAWACP